jgi:hypothetical protein
MNFGKKFARFGLKIGPLVMVLALSGSVRADVLPFTWSTSGSWTGTSTGAAFAGSAGSAGTNAAGDLLNMDLGTFTFSDIVSDYSSTFNLAITFTAPDNADDPGFTQIFTADANANGVNDRFTIDFPASALFNFSGSDGVGTFSFAVQDVDFTRNGAGQDRTFVLRGNITGAGRTTVSVFIPPSSVPEPGSVALLLSALGAVGFSLCRRAA